LNAKAQTFAARLRSPRTISFVVRPIGRLVGWSGPGADEGEADDECGVAGPFLLDAGISSSYRIAGFFGLTNAAAGRVASAHETAIAPELQHMGAPAARLARSPDPQSQVLDEEFDVTPDPTHTPLPVDIGAVITKALRAAGLMRGG
jgi:hypothetical protein